MQMNQPKGVKLKMRECN